MIEFQKLSGIYKITNTTNGKIYIGHSINMTMRWYIHLDNLMKGQHPNCKLQEDFNRYGVDAFSFSVLEFVIGKEELIKKEQDYLNGLDFSTNYNI